MEQISKNLEKNIAVIENAFQYCGDIVKRRFFVGEKKEIAVYMVYTDNIVNGSAIEESILTNIMNRCRIDGKKEGMLKRLNEEVIAIGEMTEVKTFQEIFDAVLLGDTILLMDGNDIALQASTKGFPSRGVSEAKTEVVVQGPKDAFTEIGATNIVLIRRRIRDTKLKVKRTKVGKRSKTDVAILYIEDIVRKEILQEVENRINQIDIDVILDSGYIDQLLENRWLSPFPQLQMTERPDKASSALLEGRVVIVIDNTPFVVIAPATLNVFFQAAEDYYDRWEIMSFIRLIRYCAGFLAVALPGLYIALTVFHPSMIPTNLALKIAETRQNIPFPAVGEILIMELAFELLREAGIRLPSPVSSTIGIVGGIIIGQAAVEAGIVSPSVVIVSALTGICTFVIPNIALVSGLRLTKYIVLLFSAILGLYGFWLALILMLIHMASLKSFHIPFLYPFCSASVNNYNDLEDSIFRLPLWFMKKRPIFSNDKHRQREKGGKI
ncbi:spore germination protein [Clostridium sp. MD294]|uniref:spore germination protein n=1 Tax=Clostridium sp. MD294 TaxID=97138 RepID=UPI0002CB3C82|nr:spore germination protein [Clostridium sp. MD294]USF29615.1 Spore germination protein B1 [Clostridium sp. MD294]